MDSLPLNRYDMDRGLSGCYSYSKWLKQGVLEKLIRAECKDEKGPRQDRLSLGYCYTLRHHGSAP